MDDNKDLNESSIPDIDTPSDELSSVEDGETSNRDTSLGNGYNGLAASNRQAFERGLGKGNSYEERMARNRANMDQARARANNPHKMKKGHEDEEEKTDNANPENNNYKDKNFLDKVGDKANLARNKAALAGSKIDNLRSKAFKMMHPIEAAKIVAKKKIQAWLLGILAACLPFILGIFLVIILVVVIAGDIDDDGSGSYANNGGGYSYNINGVNVSNVKVRLLRCEGNTPIPNEELVDFETYILGVVYAENEDGSYESYKAQAVAARSWALTRPKIMGGAYGITLKEEEGQWILSLRNCTYDQVYCNPSEGCWSISNGGQTGIGYSVEECTVYSGSSPQYGSHKRTLANDSDIRKAVAETQGQVLVDKNNEIIYTDYAQSEQNEWNELARQGYDYFEILTNSYGTDVRLETPDYSVVEEEGDGVATGVYAHPCPGFTRLSSKFGPRDDPNNPGQPDFHYGIDLAAPTGTKVYAFDGGTIITTRGGCVEKDSSCNGYAGNYIEVDHGNGMITRYLHLSKISVSKGQKVSKGQYIGEVGNTGASTGPHLDFKIKVNGNYVDPEKYYNFTK